MKKRAASVFVAAWIAACLCPRSASSQDLPDLYDEPGEAAPGPGTGALAAEPPPAEEGPGGGGAGSESANPDEYKVPAIVEKIKALQKKIKQSQKRMDDVVGIVLNTSGSKGSKAVLALQNQMSNSFILVQAVVSLDGAPIFKKSDDDGLLESGESAEMEVYNGAILPGDHTLSVLLVYRGAGYGIFSYLKGYRFKVRSTHKFSVKEGKGTKIAVVGYEKGDEETKMENRPAVKYVVTKIEAD